MRIQEEWATPEFTNMLVKMLRKSIKEHEKESKPTGDDIEEYFEDKRPSIRYQKSMKGQEKT